MITRRTLFEQAGMLLLASQVAEAQSGGGPGRRPVFQHDLPDVCLKDWAVTVVEVSYDPGQHSPAHRHPGITLAYVLDGEIRSKVDDGPARTYRAGEMFIEMPGQIHAVSQNASDTKPARLLALLLAKKGEPLTTTVAQD